MANKNVLTQMMIDGVLQNIMVQTGADNVIVDAAKGEMLSTRLASIATSLAGMNSSKEVDTKIKAAIDDLIGGAPETYDTLKEIADYIASDSTAMDALNKAILTKVDKVEGKGLSANDFTSALKTKLEGIAAGATKVEKSTTNGSIKINGVDNVVYAHPATAGNKHIPAGGAVGQSLIYGGSSGTAAWGTAPTIVRSGASTPQDLQEGELFFKILN